MVSTTRLTYLELAQLLHKHCGYQGEPPQTITNQLGRNADCLQWVQDAWLSIQQSHPAWKWMREEVEFSMVIGQSNYSLAEMGVDGDANGRDTLSEWIINKAPYCDSGVYLRDTTDPTPGSTVKPLRYVSYDAYRRQYKNRSTTTGRPNLFTLAADGGMIICGVLPDKAYTVTGDYIHRAWKFAEANDYPDFPDQFHRIIPFRALFSGYAIKENAPEYYTAYRTEYTELWHELTSNQSEIIDGEIDTMSVNAEPLA